MAISTSYFFCLIGGKWLSMVREKADSRAYESKDVDAMLVAGAHIIPKIQ